MPISHILYTHTHTPSHRYGRNYFQFLGAAVANLHANPESVSKFLTFSFSLSFSICGKNGKKKKWEIM